MNVASEPTPSLRPLGIGEVLDRAVTLCVRYFVPLALVYVVFAIPMGIVQYFSTRRLVALIAVFQSASQAQRTTGVPADPTAIFRQVSAADYGAAFVWLVAFAFLFAPLPIAALIARTCAFYLGRPIDFAGAYRVALTRWLPLIGLNAVYLLAGIVLYLAVALVAIVIALGIGALYVASHGVGIAVGVVFGGALLLVAIVFAVLVALAIQISYFTLVFEGTPIVRAFVSGIERVFTRRGFGRSLLFGAAWVAIGIGVAIVGGIGAGLLVAITHSDIVSAIYQTLLRIVVTLFTTVFIAIFYFDLRVREEGFDLQLAAQAERATLAG